MASMDVVSNIDLQILDNAVNNVKREIASRFDFREVKSEVTLDRKEKVIHIISGDEWKVKTIKDMLISQSVRLKADPKSLEFGEVDVTSTKTARMDVKIKEGIPRETAQKMVKYIKGLKLKVEPSIQQEQLRISSKQIDDLQETMRLLREQDFGLPLQFVNLKR